MFRDEFPDFARPDRYQISKIPARQRSRRFIGQPVAAIEIEGGQVRCLLHLLSILVFSCFSSTHLFCSAQEIKKPFTVADEIGLTLFTPLAGGEP